MTSKHLLGIVAAAGIALTPATAWAQGNDANAAAADNGAMVIPANMMDNLVASAPPAAAPAEATTPPVIYKVHRGFPWGILGLIGLIGLVPLFRRRDG